jgi:L-ascorbate metabolism protein UlaG (beta-lactamase superfamily)
MLEARRQGLVRFIGVTGHELVAPVMHLRALQRFDFDSVLLPYSYVLAQNAQYLADFNALQAECLRRNVAIQTIKSVVLSPWGEAPRTSATWYRPLEQQADIDLAVQWVLGHEGLFINTAGDIHLLPKVLDAVARFAGPPADEAMQAMVERLHMQPLFV